LARPIVLSNGELHVGINNYGLVHDFYYPYVGLENHAAGKSLRHRVGVWIDGTISWLDDGDWHLTFTYPHESLIGHIVAKNQKLDVILEFDDAVDAEFSAFIRNVHVVNTASVEREIRIFFHQAFVIGDAYSNTDTAQYLPDADAVLHYRGRRAFIISGVDSNNAVFDQYSVGLFGIEGREGTFRDADDGELSMSAVEHGRVDSTIRFVCAIAAHSSTRIHYWIACGTSTREALYIHKQLRTNGVYRRLSTTARWWHKWLKPAHDVSKKIDVRYQDSFMRSIMIIKSHIDKRGAVLASTDSAMLNYSRDAYAYCWPRDGAYVIWPLIRLGYVDEPYRFFEFCRRSMTSKGYLMHKYRADGALGSSWHPYVHQNGEVAAPIQEDETALVLFVFSQFYHAQNDPALLKEFYDGMVVPMADFLSHYIDDRTRLPKPSYDLWEEVYATTTYTTAVVYAALLAAADLAEAKNDTDHVVKWRAVADEIKEAATAHLFNHDTGCFNKSLSVSDAGDVIIDSTIDASAVFGAFMFGLFSLESKEVVSSVETIKKHFVSEDTLGIPRYERDAYRRKADDAPSNPWFITTLWMAQYALETNDTEYAHDVLQWVQRAAGRTGTIGEQIDPVDHTNTSVAPLAWSQAEYVSTLLDTITGKMTSE
jgi:GH15 family glucan-1,4-alpha-glucosidase